MMTVTSGRKCLELYGNCDPLGLLVRTCLESSIWHSTRCFLRWKMKDTKHKRLLFQLAVSMPSTKETDAPLWPTVTTGAALCGGSANFKTLVRLQELGVITEEERKNLSQGNGGKTNPEFLEWLMGYEVQFTGLVPTPRASDYKGAALKRCWRPSSQSVHVERERERERVPEPTDRACRGNAVWETWPDEPGVGRVAYGIPNRMDRIKCLGNAVVPQQFYPFFKFIHDIETKTETIDNEAHCFVQLW